MDKVGKKIVLFTESLDSGGAERQLSGLAVMLKEKGYDVRLIYFADRHFYAPYLKRHGVGYEYIPSMKGKNLRPFRLASYLRRMKADVVISYLPFCNKTACLARLLYRMKLIVSERNTTQKLDLKTRAFFFLYRLADYIVPNSYSQAEFISRNFSGLTPKVKVITNFVDTDYFCPAPGSGPEEPVRILTLARITEQKNCLRFLDAIDSLRKRTGKPFRLDWYGNASSHEYEASVHEKIEELGLDDIVTFHRASEDVLSLYRNSDIFCLPSTYEGYPNTLCEAMSCGLPVVCGNVCDNPRIVSGYLFNPFDTEDIAMTLQAVLEMSDDERRRIGGMNRERALALFSRDRFIDEYETIML